MPDENGWLLSPTSGYSIALHACFKAPPRSPCSDALWLQWTTGLMRSRQSGVSAFIATATIISTSACSPKEIEIKACLIKQSLGFQVQDTQGWFFNSKARPWSVQVFERWVAPAWDTQVPHDLIEDWHHSFQPERSVILYGATYKGWEVKSKPEPLKRGKEYVVTIWSDGGRGMINIVAGVPLPACHNGS